ncbi:MAG: VWA domain-containing protein [Candidatus Poribacteria bacterium]|nr:VWA domain-containing protein [Candidatus Poribacteria bacterium]
MLDEMANRFAEKKHRKARMRSVILLSLIFHMAVAIVYLFLPMSKITNEQSDALAFDLFKEPDPLHERRLRPKPPLSKKLLKPDQKLAKDAEQKKIDAAKNERDEVVKLSERIVIHDVEVNNAPINELVPDLMTDAKLREAEASNLSRLISQPGRTDGIGLVTGRVRARGDGSGKYRGSSQGGGGDGLLEGGGASGYKDPLGIIKFLTGLDGPQNVVFCLDISASMQAAGLNKLELALNAVKDSVLMLGSDDTFNIVPFSTTARMMSEKLLPADEKNIKHALFYLDSFTPASIQNNRGTNILAALEKAFTLDSSVIVLVTDGLPTTIKGHEIETNPQKILDLVNEMNTNKARIYVVALEIDLRLSVGAYLLQNLAHEHNGEIKVVGSKDLVEMNKQTGNTE